MGLSPRRSVISNEYEKNNKAPRSGSIKYYIETRMFTNKQMAIAGDVRVLYAWICRTQMLCEFCDVICVTDH